MRPLVQLVVLDEDPKRGGDLFALEQHFEPLPETLEALSGSGGRHVYFTYPGHYIASRREVFGATVPGIDIRADGGYVIAPPSLHPSGQQYSWEICHDPEDILPAALPAWVLHTLTTPPHTPPKASKDHPPKAVSLLASVPEGELVFPYAGPVTQADLVVLLRRRDAIERCQAHVGLAGVRLRQKFRCVVHQDQHASAALYPPRDGHGEDMYVYLDFHGADRAVWPLPVIYWAVQTGQAPRHLSKSTLVTWTVRMFIEAGVLTPAEVRAPTLPDDAPAFVRPIYEGFVRLLQCKWRIEEKRSPYTWRFAVDWTRTPTFKAGEAMVGKAIKWLLAGGIVLMAGIESGLQCFLFGSRALRQRLARGVGERLKQTQQAIVEAVQTVMQAAWADPAAPPCPGCGRTVYAPDECPQCLRLLNARLFQKRATLRARASPSS